MEVERKMERGYREQDSVVRCATHRWFVSSAGSEVGGYDGEGNRIEEGSGLRVHPNGGWSN